MKTIFTIIAIIGAMLSNPKDLKSIADVCKTQLYAMGATVIEVQPADHDTEEIYIENANGQIYTFFSDRGDYETGDNVSAIMCDMGTEIVTDDIVVSARYDRFDMLP